MSFARLKAKKYSFDEIRHTVEALVTHIQSCTSPEAIYLVGSGARDEFTDYSDLDFVIVVEDETAVRSAHKCLHRNRPIREIPVDFVLLDSQTFSKMKDIGGMAFEATHHGIKLA